MEVASLEYCKELYELSRWGAEDVSPGAEDKYIKRYDLGYLMRKMPGVTYLTSDGNEYMATYTPDTEIVELGKTAVYWFGSKKPEDALCRLATELRKQGILQNQAIL